MFLRKRVSLKPILLLEVSLIVLIASIGAACALSLPTDMGDTDLGVSYGTITDSPVTVTGYTVNYDASYNNVTSVDVDLSNTDAVNPHTVDVTVMIGNSGFVTEVHGTDSVGPIAASGTDTASVTLALAVTNLDQIQIVVEEVIP